MANNQPPQNNSLTNVYQAPTSHKTAQEKNMKGHIFKSNSCVLSIYCRLLLFLHKHLEKKNGGYRHTHKKMVQHSQQRELQLVGVGATRVGSFCRCSCQKRMAPRTTRIKKQTPAKVNQPNQNPSMARVRVQRMAQMFRAISDVTTDEMSLRMKGMVSGAPYRWVKLPSHSLPSLKRARASRVMGTAKSRSPQVDNSVAKHKWGQGGNTTHTKTVKTHQSAPDGVGWATLASVAGLVADFLMSPSGLVADFLMSPSGLDAVCWEQFGGSAALSAELFHHFLGEMFNQSSSHKKGMQRTWGGGGVGVIGHIMTAFALVVVCCQKPWLSIACCPDIIDELLLCIVTSTLGTRHQNQNKTKQLPQFFGVRSLKKRLVFSS